MNTCELVKLKTDEYLSEVALSLRCKVSAFQAELEEYFYLFEDQS